MGEGKEKQKTVLTSLQKGGFLTTETTCVLCVLRGEFLQGTQCCNSYSSLVSLVEASFSAMAGCWAFLPCLRNQARQVIAQRWGSSR